VLDEESATGDEPSKMLIVPAWQWPGAPHLGKIGREINFERAWEESATGDEPSKMLIVPAWQWPGAPHLGKIGREIIPDSERRGQIIDMFLKARDLCAVVKRAEGVWSVFGSWIVIGLAL
jgi:hypothetical protein